LWAVPIARIYEVFSLVCPLCGGQMRIIAFITHSAEFGKYWSASGLNLCRRRVLPRTRAAAVGGL
jgi:hypothetical protein